ncbi:MAG TPA: hypothetical protein VEB40_15600 [Flavipsychrobacter sp.]|nr:hypothetical protein [Flavipsychrobacter sp.]
MVLFNSEYNKKKNAFEEGIVSIRRRNNFFFLNTRSGKSIYDLSDIRSYFTLYETMGQPQLSFRINSGLPDQIKDDIQALFDSIWTPDVQESN